MVMTQMIDVYPWVNAYWSMFSRVYPLPTIFDKKTYTWFSIPLQRRHNGHDSVSNHQPHECLFSRLFRPRSKKTSKLRVTGFCAGNSRGTGEFPAQMASNAENVSIWWRHHVVVFCCGLSQVQYIHTIQGYIIGTWEIIRLPFDCHRSRAWQIVIIF